jgi:hypothetical protein
VNGIDNLLHRAILQSIQNELDSKELQRIKQNLDGQGIEFSEMVSRFIDRKKPISGFEEELKKIEDSILKEFLIVDGSKTWVMIKNRYLTELLLKTFADNDKKLILDFLRSRPETIPRTLASCSLPNTSGYRKIRQLIDDGFVIPTGLVETFEGRRTMLYKAAIQMIQITIDKNEIYAKISVPKEIIASSSIIRTLSEVSQGKRIMAN